MKKIKFETWISVYFLVGSLLAVIGYVGGVQWVCPIFRASRAFHGTTRIGAIGNGGGVALNAPLPGFFGTPVQWMVAVGSGMLGLAIIIGLFLAAILVPFSLWVNRKSKK